VSPVLTRPHPQAAPTRLGRDLAVLVVGGLVALAIIIGVMAAVEGPTFVDRVSIENATLYTLDVEVTGADRDGWLALGLVSPGDRRAVSDVVDEGDRWVVRVSSAGIDGGEVAVSRDELERSGWVITIPDEATNRLAENGATPPTARR
jgi:hypothetical protein